MDMNKTMVMLALTGCVTAATVFPGMVLAGETNESSLSGTLKELASLIAPENVDVDKMLQVVEKQLGEADSELHQVVDEIKEVAGSEGESFDLSELGQILGSLFMQDDDEWTEEEMEDLFADPTRPVIDAYILDKNASLLEQGDIQLIALEVKMEHETDDGSRQSLCTLLQMNYKAEGTDLLLAGSARDTGLFTIETAEDGTMSVTDAVFTEDGENYSSSLEAICEAYGTTADHYNKLTFLTEFDDVCTLKECLEEHPEYERIEYMGELYTLEEMEQISSEKMNQALELMSEEEPEEE